MTDWRAEALKWKNLSRKNELRAHLNLARAAILEARLELATAPMQTSTLRAAIARRVEAREREIRQIQNLMTEVPGSPQQRVKHRA